MHNKPYFTFLFYFSDKYFKIKVLLFSLFHMYKEVPHAKNYHDLQTRLATIKFIRFSLERRLFTAS